jgi:hypothetical protein
MSSGTAAALEPRPLEQQPIEKHTRRIESLKGEVRQLEERATRVSTGRLVSFLGGVVLGIAGFGKAGAVAGVAAMLCFAAFAALVVIHARLFRRERAARARLAVHERHIARLTGQFGALGMPRPAAYPAEHDYAWDIDVAGPASLLLWLDTTHTVEGERTLAAWLGEGASPEQIAARQSAVAELAALDEFRESLEAFLSSAEAPKKQGGKLDGSPFLAFTELPSYFHTAPWMLALMWLVPIATFSLMALAGVHAAPSGAWMASALLAGLLTLLTGGHAQRAFELVAQRRGYMDAFYDAFCLVERTTFTSPELARLRERFFVGGVAPSVHFRTLDRWAGLAELRTQFPLHLIANVFLMWDFHVLAGLERWNRRAGAGLAGVFTALAEIEALASLATLRALDTTTVFPEIGTAGSVFDAKDLGHPLIRRDIRITNDVALEGAGALLIVTGSNMAGKSTLLRSMGLNLALALAGGPVVARSLRVSPMRLRASMRATDSLERGASYFHAELSKLRTVTRDLDKRTRRCCSSSMSCCAAPTPRPASKEPAPWCTTS